MSLLRPLLALVLLALLGLILYTWRRSTEKELPGDPSALVISLSVTPAPEVPDPTPEPEKPAASETPPSGEGAEAAVPATPDAPAAPQVAPAASPATAAKPQVIVHFENRSTLPLKILKPLAGSERRLDLPFYELSVTNQLGTEVPMAPSGTSAEPPATMKWPDDYVIEILPGKSVDVPLQLLRTLPLPGRYKFRFTYTFDPSNAGPTGTANRMIYPKGLWIGTAQSEPFAADMTGWYALQPRK